MRIAVDAMGSDRAPFVEVHGAVVASMSMDVDVVLVGDANELKPTLAAYRHSHRVSIVHASEVIGMEDSPLQAIRQKQDSSLLVALRLLKEGKVDGMVSAGNTGAVMMASRLTLGAIKGVARCAICQLLPTMKDPVLIIDLGANIDCSARHLCEFAEMGVVYSQRALSIPSPRVGLLNIGEERAKGNDILKSVHKSLTAIDHINFIGNVEPGAMMKGAADVVVCDGLHGNLVLKTLESTAAFMSFQLKRQLSSSLPSRLGALFGMGALRRLKKTLDPNEYTGAPLLGVNGVVVIGHGSSSARGIANLIHGAAQAAETRVNEYICEGIGKMREADSIPDEQGQSIAQ